MKLARALMPNDELHVVLVDEETVQLLDLTQVDHIRRMSDIIHAPDPLGLTRFLTDTQADPVSLDQVRFLAPVDQQEVWAAGVTYKRSQVARMEESESAATHYDHVYSAERPEIFFKSTAQRVVNPGDPVRARVDSGWSVPEPEFAIFVTPELKVAGYTIGNDMSARDIEGENPLYLPQAKMYDQCCSLGPYVTLASEPLTLSEVTVEMTIFRNDQEAFSGTVALDQLNRTFDELAGWLGKEMSFADGAILLTGTGIVPDDSFTLEDGDRVDISISNIGTLSNPVVKGR